MGFPFFNVVQDGAGNAIGNASVAICADAANVNVFPCTPISAIFSDEALTMPIANPMLSDPLGRYKFWIASGTYTVQVYGTSLITPYSFSIFTGSGASSLPSETTASFTTASIAPGANVTGSIALFKNFNLGNVQVSSSARVRLYATQAARDADVTRPPSVQVTPGLQNELISAHNLTGLPGVPLNFQCSPPIPGYSTNGTCYWTVTNTGLASVAITVTFTLLQLGT